MCLETCYEVCGVKSVLEATEDGLLGWELSSLSNSQHEFISLESTMQSGWRVQNVLMEKQY